MVAATDVVAAD